jgi:ACR3 family arsenite efflux pump ArsB
MSVKSKLLLYTISVGVYFILVTIFSMFVYKSSSISDNMKDNIIVLITILYLIGVVATIAYVIYFIKSSYK